MQYLGGNLLATLLSLSNDEELLPAYTPRPSWWNRAVYFAVVQRVMIVLSQLQMVVVGARCILSRYAIGLFVCSVS